MSPGCHRMSMCLLVIAPLVQKQCRQKQQPLIKTRHFIVEQWTTTTWTSRVQSKLGCCQKQQGSMPRHSISFTLCKRDFKVSLMGGTRHMNTKLVDRYRYSSLSAAKSRNGNKQLFNYCFFVFCWKSCALKSFYVMQVMLLWDLCLYSLTTLKRGPSWASGQVDPFLPGCDKSGTGGRGVGFLVVLPRH